MSHQLPHAPPPGVTLLRLLGPVHLDGVGDTDAVVTRPQRLAVLAVLAIDGATGFVRRDRLAGLLWPELTDSSGRGALRKAVHAIRAALGENIVVARGTDELRVQPADLWCDAVAFDAARDTGHHARALELYRGPLLDGFAPPSGAFGHWLDQARARYAESALDSAWTLAMGSEREHELTRAARWARTVVRLAGTDERRIRSAMELLDRTGNRADALRCYREFAERLRLEFDVTPAAETRALAARLSAD